MRKETQVAITRRVLKLLEVRTSELAAQPYCNPVAAYTSEDHLESERKRLFLERPQIFTLSCRMPGAGDYVSHDLNGVPIVAIRDGEGKVNAFLNVCRHRGAQVVKGCGSGMKSMSCPYHAWNYDLQGALKALVPPFGFEGLKKEDHGLVPLPCAEQDGLVWVTPSRGQAIDPEAYLQGLAPELREFQFGDYFHYETRMLDKPVNWKLVIDTFLETWHVSTLHKDTVAPIFLANASNVFDAFGEHGRMIIPRRSLLDLKNQPEEEWNLLPSSAIVYQIFPHTLLNWQGDHMEMWRPFPGKTPNEMSVEVSLYVPEEPVTERSQKYWGRNMDLLMRTVAEEDFPICDGIQRGFASGAQDHITYGRNEPALSHFHQSLARALAGASTASIQDLP